MSKTKKLVKEALKHPELYTEGDLMYFRMWLKLRKERKERKKEERRSQLERNFQR